MCQALKDKVALVTGGSRGIGRAVCQELASCGCEVYVNFSSRVEAAQETVDICASVGGRAQVLGFNVADSAAVDAAVETIRQKSGRLDILVNNAGITVDGLMIRMKDEDWARVLQTNLSGAMYCARAAARLMVKARAGRIINISSIVGQMGNAGQASYCASKAGLIGLTKSMARELAGRGILVNAVAPGFIETDMTSALDEKVKAEHFKSIPLGRYGSAQDIARVVTFLAGEGAQYITGQVVGVNGGMYM
ncbi:MAG: 3-oxoacyl-[acyl-carrier-protein] reductase [Deltaproteobacteria bacterium]|nr:3-oxoacyl-[acyl-carrier-protein] reductase [Deltaproteobacteria bacterium]